MKKHYRKENDCLNCGTILQGKFCHNCGQENLHIRESFGHMVDHAVSDYFHFDHQFFHTLKPLLFKPGYLTNEYMAGKRVRYLHPVKMYIFISVVYFLLLFQSGQELVHVNDNAKPVGKGIVLTSPDNKDLDSVKKEIAANSFIPGAAKKEIQRDIDKQKVVDKKDVKNITDYRKEPNKWFHPTTKDTSYQQYLANQKKLTEDNQDGFITRQWNKKVFDYDTKYGHHAQEVFVENFKHNIPKMMFLLLPLFALILKVTFFRSKKFYVEHLIYAIHFHCFLFLFLGIMILLKLPFPANWGVSGWIDAITTFYIIWYIYRSLKTVYHRSRFRTITKALGMSIMYFISFSFCITLIVLITAIL